MTLAQEGAVAVGQQILLPAAEQILVQAEILGETAQGSAGRRGQLNRLAFELGTEFSSF